MPTFQEIYDEHRREYMDSAREDNTPFRPIAFQKFYCWLADEIGIREYEMPFTLAELQASIDPHFNDLPLRRWDAYDSLVRAKAGRHGMRSWSLSDSVCVLKAYARRMVEKAEKN